MRLLYFVALFFGFLYLAAPLLIWLTNKMPANPLVTQFDLTNLARMSQLAQTTATLQSMGFDLIGMFGLIGQVQNVDTYLTLLVHRHNRDYCLSTVVQTPLGIKLQMLEFDTKFPAGSSVTTNNNPMPDSLVRPPHRPTYKFPGVLDPVRLYRLHQLLIWRDKQGAAKELETEQDGRILIAAAMRRELESQIEPGIMRLDAAGQYFRMTLKGAYLASWKLLFPVKQIMAAVRLRQSHALARALEEGTGAALAASR